MSQQNDSKVPEIRFKGFAGEWEEKELGELADIKLGKMLDKAKHTSGQLLPYLNNISLRWNSVDTSNLPQMYFKDDELERFGLQAGDVVVCEGGEPGRSAIWDGHLPNLKFQKAIHRVRFTAPYEAPFLVLHLQNIVGTNRIEMLFTGGGIKHLTRETFSLLKVPRPSLPEQQKIAHFLSELDRMIGLHQRKHDKLVTLKQAMLQKMFPQDGATTPEIRFNGFTEPWEEKQLDAVGEFNPKAALPEVFEYVDLESVVGTQMVGHRTEFRDSAPSRAQRLAQKGDLFFQTVRPYQRNNHLFNLSREDFVFSTGYAQIRPFNDGSFLLSAMQRNEFVKVVLDNCTGTSYPAINSNDLAKIQIRIPSPLEQERIGAYFRDIDKLISKNATQLEKLKNIKSACLEKMFV